MQMIDGKALSFDDVVLLPQYSEVPSRLSPDISFQLGKFSFPIPVISSPMDTVTGYVMASAMNDRGGLGILHRFDDIDTRAITISLLKELRISPIAVSIGIQDCDYKNLEMLVRAGADIVCIDIANAATKKFVDFFNRASDVFKNFIIGNVATYETTMEVLGKINRLPLAIRVGVGPGSVCTTRVVTGHGYPQFSAIWDCRMALNDLRLTDSVSLIADGGIRSSGDAVKALGAGADAVMLGRLLAGFAESAGRVIEVEGSPYKKYRGSSSSSIVDKTKGEKSGHYSPEGVDALVPFRSGFDEFMKDFCNGIRYGLAYSGAENIKRFQEISVFSRQTRSGMIEGNYHDVIVHAPVSAGSSKP